MRRILLSLLTIIVGFFFCVTSTEWGLKGGVTLANRLLANFLHIKHAEGYLSQMQLQGIDYHDERVDLHIDKLYLNWNPFALLQARLRINTLLITHPIINIKPSKSTEQSTSNPVFYLKYLQFHRLQLSQLVLTLPDATTHYVKRAAIYSHDFIHYEFTTDLFASNTSGHLNLNWQADLNWQLDVLSKSLNLAQANSKLIGLINVDGMAEGQVSKLTPATWRVQLRRLDGELNHYPLQGKGELSYQHQKLIVKSVDINVANAYLRATGSLEKECRFSWDLQLPDLQRLAPSMHGNFSLKGEMAGECDNPDVQAMLEANAISFEKYKLNKLIGKINLSLLGRSDITLQGSKIDLNGYQLNRIDVSGNVQREKKALISHWRLTTDKQAALLADITLPAFTHFSDTKQSIIGSIRLSPLSLQTLGFSLPQMKDLRGQLSGNIDLSGSLSELVWKGGIVLSQGTLMLPVTNTRIEQIGIKASFDKNNQINFDGRLKMGAGIGTITGQLNLNPELKGSLTLQGNRLTILNSNQYKLQANPKLTLDYSLKEIAVNGSVHIPTANISPVNYVNVVTLPKDVVFVDQPKETSYMPSDLKLNVNITLGKPIVFKYQDLTTEVGGGLTIYSIPNSALMAKGELVLEKGTYQAYGNVLSIQQGRIIFDNSLLTNPRLDIKAAKQVRMIAMSGNDQVVGNLQSSYMGADNTYVGVTIKGNAEQPLVKLYSAPAGLSQGDILSYLLFGYPQSELSGGNKGALLSALATLNLPSGGTGGVTDKLKNFIGLSDIGVGSTEVFDQDQNTVSRQTTVNVGKKLADKLFINYSLGLFSSLSILSIRYQLTPRFAVQSEASSFETAGDLLYRYERD